MHAVLSHVFFHVCGPVICFVPVTCVFLSHVRSCHVCGPVTCVFLSYVWSCHMCGTCGQKHSTHVHASVQLKKGLNLFIALRQLQNKAAVHRTICALVHLLECSACPGGTLPGVTGEHRCSCGRSNCLSHPRLQVPNNLCTAAGPLWAFQCTWQCRQSRKNVMWAQGQGGARCVGTTGTYSNITEGTTGTYSNITAWAPLGHIRTSLRAPLGHIRTSLRAPLGHIRTSLRACTIAGGTIGCADVPPPEHEVACLPKTLMQPATWVAFKLWACRQVPV